MGIRTDFYQLTMMQGYLRAGLTERLACFDLFFRRNPFGGGYALTAGLDEALDYLATLRFDESEIEYLSTLGTFESAFLEHLARFRFTGAVAAMPEGSVAFPFEPVMQVIAPLGQCQLVETTLLNIINFQTLVATKAARLCQEAGQTEVVEFGMRRAQGPNGALAAARAAHIGGCAATSNVEAAMRYGIPPRGTHAHAWVTAFGGELEAFRAYARQYPNSTVLLVDTYDTLKSGVPNAITVAKEMEREGANLRGIRLDSGDLAFLSSEARRMLDAAGLNYVKIFLSNELDEHIIHDLKIQGARADAYGVGTKLVTADGDPSLTGVFKMSAIRPPEGGWRLTMKKSDAAHKSTFPGVKQVWRMYGAEGYMIGDLMELDGGARPDFESGVEGYHPFLEGQHKTYRDVARVEPLLAEVMRGGERLAPPQTLKFIRERAKASLNELHPTTRRLLNPHIYKVSLGERLHTATVSMRESAAR